MPPWPPWPPGTAGGWCRRSTPPCWAVPSGSSTSMSPPACCGAGPCAAASAPPPPTPWPTTTSAPTGSGSWSATPRPTASGTPSARPWAWSWEPLAAAPRFVTTDARREKREELIRLLDETFASRPRREWLEVLERHDLIFSPVNEIEDLPQDPQVLANGFFADFDHPTLGPIKVVAPPLEMSATPATVRSPAPELGQHTAQVLLELGGYTWEDIARLKDQGII